MDETLTQGLNGTNDLLLEEWYFQSDDDDKAEL